MFFSGTVVKVTLRTNNQKYKLLFALTCSIISVLPKNMSELFLGSGQSSHSFAPTQGLYLSLPTRTSRSYICVCRFKFIISRNATLSLIKVTRVGVVKQIWACTGFDLDMLRELTFPHRGFSVGKKDLLVYPCHVLKES